MTRSSWQTALDLLARREHSQQELLQKLKQRGFEDTDIKATLSKCMECDVQSDIRFAEMYTRSRVQRGYGPLKIQQELRFRGIDDELISACINDPTWDWVQQIQQVKEKKFPCARPSDDQEKARQIRFLIYRGFFPDHIRMVYWN